MEKVYICIDLKSFYASVECRDRGLDPLNTNLVVADNSRTEKTICLAVSPSLKRYGIAGRSRLFEVIQKVREVNRERKKIVNKFSSKSYIGSELDSNKYLELDYIVAPPRMSRYMKYSTEIYNIYLKYIAVEDIYVYSIDEVFMDITKYLNYYKMSSEELVTKIIKDVYDTTGITATAGIGTNLYLCKIAMDIVAKKSKANSFGVRIASLNEESYRKILWDHKPLTDFWRLGVGYNKKLNDHGIYTMGDICRTSLNNEELLYKLFGVNAEILIDHAWGYEPCTIESIKSYKPTCNSVSTGQVLHCPYNFSKTKIIVKEMCESLALDLVKRGVVSDKFVLTIGYDISNVDNKYKGEVTIDRYGRSVPKHAHGTVNLDFKTSSTKVITDGVISLYSSIVNKNLLVRRINIAACDIVLASSIKEVKKIKQFDLFSNYEEEDKKEKIDMKLVKSEEKLQEILISIKDKYGKNAILKGMNLSDGATMMDRNKQIGGHHE